MVDFFPPSLSLNLTFSVMYFTINVFKVHNVLDLLVLFSYSYKKK